MTSTPVQTGLAFAAALAVSASLTAACGQTSSKPYCNVTTCQGCCDAVTGVCKPGVVDTSCGKSGDLCLSCPAGQRCVSSMCAGPTGGGAGGGGGGDGSDGGGGLGGGSGGPDGGTVCSMGCTAPTPVCDSSTSYCVGCTSNLHCFGSRPYCDQGTKSCTVCTATAGCRAPLLCDTSVPGARCVSCVNGNQCGSGAPICDRSTGTCVTCTIGSGCTGAAPVCDIFVPGGRCVQCLADTHCPGATPYCDLLHRQCVSEVPNTGSPIGGGTSFTCALNGDAGVRCFGYNTYGQLGDGTTASRSTPGDATGLTGDVLSIAGGSSHTCVLTRAGGLKCFGYNSYGQLGDGTSTTRGLPGDVTGLTSNVLAVDLGGNHTCALTGSGGVKCWGYNYYGQLGNGSTATSTLPVDVQGLTSGVLAVTAGTYHSCALTAAGGVKCWGNNSSGQLGNGGSTPSQVPVDVQGLTSGVLAVSAGGSHTCAVTAAGLKCWGYNYYGQLGNASTANSPTPVDVTGAAGSTAVAAGSNHSCAITGDAGVRCWGYNYYGQLGDSTTLNHNAPADVTGLGSDVQALGCGDNHCCVRMTAGNLKCWGSNSYGQLGVGSPSSSSSPLDVTGF